jgi:hypothetical protein
MLRTIVVFFLALQAGFMSLELRLLVVKEVFVNSECLTFLGDKSITTTGVFNGFLPLEVELVALLMKSFKFFGGFIKLNLGGLGFSDFLLKFAALTSDLDGKFFDLKSELLNFRFVGASVLFQSEIVLFLLASSEGPLFKFLLVPVHFKFELVHPFVGFEDHVLDVVETILLVGNALFELLDFVLEAARLAFGNLLHVFLGFDFLVFVVDKGLGVDELHFDGLEMLHQDFEALLVLFNFESELGDEADLFTDNLVEFFVLVVGVGWEILVQVVLGNGVYYFVCHGS